MYNLSNGDIFKRQTPRVFSTGLNGIEGLLKWNEIEQRANKQEHTLTSDLTFNFFRSREAQKVSFCEC
jgi:hypothetical protein